MGLALGIGIPVLYFLIGLGTYRRCYTLRRIEFLRWQNAKPDAFHAYDKYGGDKKPRKQFTYYQWMSEIQDKDWPGWVATCWLFYLILMPIVKIARPEVKVPSYTKIEELEKL